MHPAEAAAHFMQRHDMRLAGACVRWRGIYACSRVRVGAVDVQQMRSDTVAIHCQWRLQG